MSYPSIPTDSLPQGRTNFTANVVWKASASVSEMNFLRQSFALETLCSCYRNIYVTKV